VGKRENAWFIQAAFDDHNLPRNYPAQGVHAPSTPEALNWSIGDGTDFSVSDLNPT